MVTTESKAGKAGFGNGLFVSTLQTAAKVLTHKRQVPEIQ